MSTEIAETQAQLDHEIAETQAQLDELLQRYDEKHPDVIATRETLAELKQRRLRPHPGYPVINGLVPGLQPPQTK
jgi:hypothetical protein